MKSAKHCLFPFTPIKDVFYVLCLIIFGLFKTKNIFQTQKLFVGYAKKADPQRLIGYVIVRIWIVPVKQNLSSRYCYPQLRISLYTHYSIKKQTIPERTIKSVIMPLWKML